MTVIERPEMHPADAYTLALPKSPRPIVLLGAGGIVKDAHLPAYSKANFPLFGIADIVVPRAQALAEAYGISHVFGSVGDAVAAAPADAVYDLALMPDQFPAALEALPDGAPVLIQKPLGNTLHDGLRLLEICRRKRLVAAVNTQLRFAPYIAAVRRLIADGEIGELYDFEFRINVMQPWYLFPEVLKLPRIEINMHSVHYLDLVRSFLGDPDSVSATTVKHPSKAYANTRSDIILRYRGRDLRVVINTNHDHIFGPEQEQSFIKWEGTRGAIFLQLGLLLDYPTGGADILRIARTDAGLTPGPSRKDPDVAWQDVPFEGSWFPDAFMGSMGALQRYLEGSVPTLPTAVDDVIKTMALVEAAYTSHDFEGIDPRLSLAAAGGQW